MANITIALRRESDGAEVLVTIDEQGNTMLVVRGARGMTCRALTADIEAALGSVKARHLDPRAVAQAASGHEDATVDAAIVKSGAGGGWCG